MLQYENIELIMIMQWPLFHMHMMSEYVHITYVLLATESFHHVDQDICRLKFRIIVHKE